MPDRFIWEFPKIRGTLFWGPYNYNYTEDPTTWGIILGSPIFRNSHIRLLQLAGVLISRFLLFRLGVLLVGS